MALENIRDGIKVVLALIRGDWSDAWGLLKGIVSRALSTAVGVAKNMGKAIVSAVKSIGKGIGALASYFWQQGSKLGKRVVDGVKDGVRDNAASLAGDLAGLLGGPVGDAVDAAIASASRSRKRGSRPTRKPSGVSVLGEVFGPNVKAGDIMRYARLEGEQPYSVTQAADGSQSVKRNENVINFLTKRREANQRQLRRRTATRNKVRAKAERAKKAWLAAKRGKRSKKVIAERLDVLLKLVDILDELDAEILALGGAIESDSATLLEPEIDNSGVEDAAKKTAEQEKLDAENLKRLALGDKSVEEERQLAEINAIRVANGLAPVKDVSEITRKSAPSVVQGSNYQPLLPSSVSASGAVESAAMRAMTGSGVTVNVHPASGDAEAIAHRVAFILGSSRLRAGGAF